MAKVGPMLMRAFERIEQASVRDRGNLLRVLSDRLGAGDDTSLPATIQLRHSAPRKGETWDEYRDRIERELARIDDVVAGGSAQHLILSNGISSIFPLEQLAGLAELDQIDALELDPVLNPTQMDEAFAEVGVPELVAVNPALSGTGVRVAVLDTGIDLNHPFLRVEHSVSTCGEDVSIPGIHATHCAGALASRDGAFRGIAPDVTLLNIKVVKHNNRGSPTGIARGLDEAVALQADIVSMSLGFNHLPVWSDRGHGWSCANGDCVLCTAIENAALFGLIAVVAGGNEHARAEALRRFGAADSFDTELTCPGQARNAVTVAAVTKRPFAPADFSSRGPAAYGGPKPVFSGPGVNIMSTVPAPRAADGSVLANVPRADLFGADSGTSIATPIVAGAIALVLQDRRSKGLDTSRNAVIQAFARDALGDIGLPESVVGAGVVDLASFATAADT